jgi:hypothetical protein
MSHINQWLSDLALLPDVNINHWQAFQHRHESFTYIAVDLPAVLRDLGEVSGWLTETSRVVSLHASGIELQNLPLAGEFYQGQHFWQLTQLPRGRWQLNSYRLTTCAATEATCLGESVEHLQAGSRNGRLRYWRLWEPDQDNAPHCRIALLADIQEASA